MTKLLTTGEMIDRLKVGEIAESVDDFAVKRLAHGEIVTIQKDNHSLMSSFILTEPYLKTKWQILPRYISFKEAIHALKSGKTVAYLDKLGNLRKVYPREFKINRISSYEIGGHSLLNLYDGKWTIVED